MARTEISSTKVVLPIFAACLVLVLIGLMSLTNMRRMAKADKSLVENGSVPLVELSHIAVTFQRMRIASRDALATTGGEERKKFLNQVELLESDFDKSCKRFDQQPLSLTTRKAFDDFKQSSKNYFVYLAQIVHLAKAGQDKQAWEILHGVPYNIVIDAQLASLHELETLQVEQVAEVAKHNAALSRTSIVEVAAAVALALITFILGALWVSRSERQKINAQQALQKSEERFQLVASATNDGMWDWDVLAGTVWWNDNVQTGFGYAADEIAPSYAGWESRVHPEDRERIVQSLSEARGGDASTWAGEFRFARRDGSYADVLDRGRIIRDGSGKAIRMVGAMMDITARKSAEAALRQSEEQFRQLADNIREVFFILMPDPPRMAYISPAYDQIWGRPGQELYERAGAWIDSVHPENREFVSGIFAQSLAGLSTEMEYRMVRPDGSIRLIHARSFPVHDAQGKFIRAVGIAEDVTEQRRVMEVIQAAKAAAEAASRAKSEFLANMSHELRTPMNGIMGMTELALETDLTSEQREYLNMVKASADSLLTVINDVLDFSKIEAGKLEFESIEFKLRSSLETIAKVLALRAHEKGLELTCHVAPDVPETLISDPNRLRQIVVNLVGNAIKFTEQGEIAIEVQHESDEEGAVILQFTVRDTGIGIPQERQTAIFEAFAQADGSTTRRYGGSGLGLSVCRRLVEMFGGRIWVESTVGQGSSFHFTARFGVGTEPGWALPLEAAKLKGVPVLVVDDNPTNRRILEEMLSGWKMNTAVAGEARSALNGLKQAADAGRPFALVLVDANMPDVDGFTLIGQIKEDGRLQTAAIMMLTSAGQRGDAARCRELGVDAYLTKPIGRAELFTAILQVLGSRSGEAGSSRTLVTRHSLREHKKCFRILLAEDNLVNRTVVIRLLQKHGHTVGVATNGHEVLRKLESGNFDLVLMDVQMPEMDGFQATRAIRDMEKSKGGHVPIIAMTAYALKGDRERCLAAGMDGYISKPFRLEELLREVGEISKIAIARSASVHG